MQFIILKKKFRRKLTYLLEKFNFFIIVLFSKFKKELIMCMFCQFCIFFQLLTITLTITNLFFFDFIR
jgi:hypothetical protein